MSLAFLDALNPQQREAVTSADGPLLVLAGAGSGKTRVIACRIAHLIAARGVSPGTILAVTFTNKAAEEMRRRVRTLCEGAATELAVHTFHALCLRLLRRFGEDVGLRREFTVYAESERRSLLRRVCRQAKLPEREFPIARVAAAVSAAKHRAFSGRPAPQDRFTAVVEMVAERYQKELEAVGAVDFDDLLLRGVELLECSERAQSFAERRFRHVLVDEYQDTNRVQYRLLRLLAPHGNIFVVGDEDQSIYNFRGADLRNILDFERDFRGARVVKLEVNYRSTSAILKAADAVIRNNRDRKGKRLIATVGEGARPELHAAEDERQEAAFVAEAFEKLRREEPAVRAAVLLRTHAQTRVFEEELVSRNLPHQVVGGLRFYERREIKDTLAYLRLVSNPHSDADYLRVVNAPPRGVGAATLEALERRARETSGSLWEASLDLLDSEALAARPRLGLGSFRDLLERLSRTVDVRRPSRAIETVLNESGLLAAIERAGEAAARERKENLDQLVAAAAEYEARERKPSLASFLDSVSLLTDIDTAAADAPCFLMTLHAAKGLEFDVVFLAGLEEGLFPHVLALGDKRGLEEERRLFYVGMTRAKRTLFLSFARSRRFTSQAGSRSPSRFLAEIPRDFLDAAASPHPPLERTAGGLPSLRPGAVVHHETFGEGRVVDSSGKGRDRKVTVLFRNAGRKRLVAAYAKLRVVG